MIGGRRITHQKGERGVERGEAVGVEGKGEEEEEKEGRKGKRRKEMEEKQVRRQG